MVDGKIKIVNSDDMDYARGVCGHCNNGIEFPVGAAGETIDCPHCAGPTELRVPAVARLERSDMASLRLCLAIVVGVIGACFIFGGIFEALNPGKTENSYSGTSTIYEIYANHSDNPAYWN